MKTYLQISDAALRGQATGNVIAFPITRTLSKAERTYQAEQRRVDRLEREGKYAQFGSHILHWHFEARGEGLRLPHWHGRKK
jgi:hypothetical protein